MLPVPHCAVHNNHQTIAPEGPGILCLPRTTVRTPRFNDGMVAAHGEEVSHAKLNFETPLTAYLQDP